MCLDIFYRYRKTPIKGGSGEDSSKARILGRRGNDYIMKVPTGITIFDDNNVKIGELNETGDTCIVASGGIGGCSGNNFLGTKGQERVVTLDLKLIADVGMVNLQNFFCCCCCYYKFIQLKIEFKGWISECWQKYSVKSVITSNTENCRISL